MRATGTAVALVALAGCEFSFDVDVEPRRERLDPDHIPKYVTPLPIPAAMPAEGTSDGFTVYEVAARPIEQQVLPPGFPRTPVFAYGAPDQPSTFHWPAWSVEARSHEPVRVTWRNELVDEDGKFVPHILPLDATLHWARPEEPTEGNSDRPDYDGPVPMVVHVHGGHVADTSDGLPDAWYLPDAADVPQGFRTQGSRYATERPAGAGEAVFEYPNDRQAATLLYHDHALGMTRNNVYAGLLGFWFVRDTALEASLDLPGPAPRVGDPPETRFYEIPLAIQDRSFWDDGSLFYPSSRAYFDDYTGPFWPESDVHPVHNPEFFGDVMTVNGATWPYLEVEPRLYRFRVANGSDSRFLILDLEDPALDFVVIGNDNGYLPGAPAVLDQLLLGPAERADVLVDFSALAPGDEVRLLNLGPDEPFRGVDHPEAPPPSNPSTTGQVMRFRVVPRTGEGHEGSIPSALPTVQPLQTALPPRDLLLWENTDPEAGVPSEALLGSVAAGPLEFDLPVTEIVREGDTEIWRLVNTTADAHPIHLHLVSFQVVGREPFRWESFLDDEQAYLAGQGALPDVDDYLLGGRRGPDPTDEGWKDTVIAYPGEVTTLIATFDRSGQYVWHCHILEHEDNEMMRPFLVE